MVDKVPTAEELMGLHSDLVLETYGRPYRITVVGRNSTGLVARWHYKNFKLTFTRIIGNEPINNREVSAYFVTEVYIKENRNDKPTRKRHKRNKK
jgi:hypothetical protein